MFDEEALHRKTLGTSKINFPPADRNKDHILKVLRKHFQTTEHGKVLEIASGTGQHIAFFAPYFPKLTFQPTEYDTTLFDSIKAYADDAPEKNIKYPIQLNAADDLNNWNMDRDYDYAICINLIHVSPYECTIGLFKNGASVVKPGGLLATYGAYAYNGEITPESNAEFDKSLRAKNPSWGLRDILEVEKLANDHKWTLLEINDLPANNKCLIWQRQT